MPTAASSPAQANNLKRSENFSPKKPSHSFLVSPMIQRNVADNVLDYAEAASLEVLSKLNEDATNKKLHSDINLEEDISTQLFLRWYCQK